MNIDQSKLDEEPFSYRAGKDNLFIFRNGKRVKILKGKEAGKVLGRLGHAAPHAAQVIMAKLTGNFKRGNEHK